MKIPQTKGSYRCYLPVHGPQQGKGYAEGGEVPEKGFSAARPKFRRSENIDDSRGDSRGQTFVKGFKLTLDDVVTHPTETKRDYLDRVNPIVIDPSSQLAKDAGLHDVGRKGK